MNDQDKKEIQERLSELNEVLNNFHYEKQILGYIGAIAIFIIGIIVITTVGEWWGTILLVLAFFPLFSSKSNEVPIKQLSEHACILMNSILNITKYDENDTKRQILSYSVTTDNLSLYNNFIRKYPHMQSLKLKKLASVVIGYQY